MFQGFYVFRFSYEHQPWKYLGEVLTLALSTAWWLGVVAAVVWIVRVLS